MEEWGQATIAATWRGHAQRAVYRRLLRRYRRARHTRQASIGHQKLPVCSSSSSSSASAQEASTASSSNVQNNTRSAIRNLAKLKREKEEKQQQKLREKEHQNNAAATVVQNTYRRKAAYSYVRTLKEKARAEKGWVVLQALVRGRSSRRKSARALRQRRIRLHQRKIRERTRQKVATVNIQRVYRGYQCRAGLIKLMETINRATSNSVQENQKSLEAMHASQETTRRKKQERVQKREERRKLEEERRNDEMQIMEEEHDEQRRHQEKRELLRAAQKQQKQQKQQKVKAENADSVDIKKESQQKERQKLRREREELRQHAERTKIEQQEDAARQGERVVQAKHQQELQKAKRLSQQDVQRQRKEQEKEQKEAVAAAAAATAEAKKRKKRRRSDPKHKRKEAKKVVSSPETEMQKDLSGLWTGECLDEKSNVTKMIDCILRFYNDEENGQSMIEGRSKTSSETSGTGMVLFQGVWDFNSSRFILVNESPTGKITFMGWMKPRRPESAKLTIQAMGKEAARGVGHTLEGNAGTGHISLRKRENTKRASVSNIKQLIGRAKDFVIMKRGNAAGTQKMNSKKERKQQKGQDQRDQRGGQAVKEGVVASKHGSRSGHGRQGKSDKRRNSSRKKSYTVVSDQPPMKRLALRFDTLQTSIRTQLNGAKKHLKDLAGPLGHVPEHMNNMSKDVDRMLDRANGMGRQLKALETKLSLFGYPGVVVEEDYLMCFDGPPRRQQRGTREEDEEGQDDFEEEEQDEHDTNTPSSPLPSTSKRKRPAPLISSSVFEALQPDFLPSSAVGRKRGASRASSRGSNGSLMSRGSSRDSVRSTRSRGTTPVASKRLAKFFSAVKEGAAQVEEPVSVSMRNGKRQGGGKRNGSKKLLKSLPVPRLSKHRMSEPSLRSLQVIVSTPRDSRHKTHRRRLQLPGLQLDPMME